MRALQLLLFFRHLLLRSLVPHVTSSSFAFVLHFSLLSSFTVEIKVAPAMSNYRPNVAERPAPGQWYDHDIDYAENSETDLNVFFYGLSLKVLIYRQSVL